MPPWQRGSRFPQRQPAQPVSCRDAVSLQRIEMMRRNLPAGIAHAARRLLDENRRYAGGIFSPRFNALSNCSLAIASRRWRMRIGR